MKARTCRAGLYALFLAAAAVAAPAASAAKSEGHEPTKKAQTTCPVMGGKIDKKISADYQGKRIYLCCAKCVDTFKKDPDKYIKKLEEQGVALASAGKPQTVCPVMGGKIDKKISADHQGKRIYFCCARCVDTFKKDPDKYLKKLASQGVAPEDAPSAKDKHGHKSGKGHHKHKH